LAAKGGHLDTLKWIRSNGGKWTSAAAQLAAKSGHLETLKWIRAEVTGEVGPQDSKLNFV
jgi:hypothetical protein